MLTDFELDKIVTESLHISHDPMHLIENVMNRVRSCSKCRELFSNSDKLLEHLKNYHSELLSIYRTKQKPNYLVKEQDTKIYICPHCHYAVGLESQMYGVNNIIKHVENCQQNLSGNMGPAHVSYSISQDATLIQTYLSNCFEITMYQCFKCKQFFSTSETVAEHLILKHSSPCKDDLTEQQLEFIQLSTLITQSKENQKKIKFTKLPEQDSSTSQQEFSSTISQDEITSGFVSLPQKLSSVLGHVQQIKVQLAGNPSSIELPYIPKDKQLLNLSEWFKNNVIEPGDILKFYILNVTNHRVIINRKWSMTISTIDQVSVL